jgi:hypothetical protein
VYEYVQICIDACVHVCVWMCVYICNDEFESISGRIIGVENQNIYTYKDAHILAYMNVCI